MSAFPESGFAALGSELPRPHDPRNWLVWHFTHVDNLAAIVEAGHMLSPNMVEPTVNVALNAVKTRRRRIAALPDGDYPIGKFVADHVPFYIAARSPMLLSVTSGHADYKDGTDSIVFFGLSIGNIVDAGLTWCASNASAATDHVQFTRQIDLLGTFVDFDLLCRKWWGETTEDPDRPSRRAAEVLVLDQLPIKMITHVAAKNDTSLEVARSAFNTVGGTRQYHVRRRFYYD